MKKHLLAFPFLAILCVCISAHSTIQRESGEYLGKLITSDTIKTVTVEDSLTAITELDRTAAVEAAQVEMWKEWRTVDNFAFGKNRGNLPMIADLHSLHPFFRDKIVQLIKNCEAKGIDLVVVESYRTRAKQKEYYNMGRKYTRSAGGKSKHQYGLAVDVVPVKDSVAIWDNVSLWRKIGTEGEKLGLRWGGRWKSPYDPAHFEWTGGLTSYHLGNGILPVIPKVHAENYPCVHDDIDELKKHWEMWEVEQSVISRKNLKPSIASGARP
jgi:peptidoglycan L-alanyl-D-glutamate endopeptidase CwlK